MSRRLVVAVWAAAEPGRYEVGLAAGPRPGPPVEFVTVRRENWTGPWPPPCGWLCRPPWREKGGVLVEYTPPAWAGPTIPVRVVATFAEQRPPAPDRPSGDWYGDAVVGLSVRRRGSPEDLVTVCRGDWPHGWPPRVGQSVRYTPASLAVIADGHSDPPRPRRSSKIAIASDDGLFQGVE